MPDKSQQHIDALYQRMRSCLDQMGNSLDEWRTQSLLIIHPEYSSESSLLPPPPTPLNCFDWINDKKFILDFYTVFSDSKFIIHKEVDFQTNFLPRFSKGIPVFSKIVCKRSAKDIIWAFDTLQDCHAISGKNDLRIFLPLHFLSKGGRSLKPNNIKQELYEIRKLKKAAQYPDFVLEIQQIFSKKSLPKS